MKKNALPTALVTIALFACALLLPDGLIYAVTAFMAMGVLSIVHVCRSGVVKMTRWSKANPHKAQWFIAGIEIILMGLGLIAGFNLKQLGFIFSDVTAFVFFAFMVLGFLSVPFWPKRNTVAIPREVDRQRLAYLGISLSFLITMAFVGNRIGDTHPDSILSLALEKTDRLIFPPPASETDQQDAWTGSDQNVVYPLALASLKISDGQTVEDHRNAADKTALKKAAKAEKKMKREEKKLERKARKDLRRILRMAAGGGMCALAVLLIILLLGTTCAGVCLFIYGVSDGAVAAIIFGPVVVALSLWGIIKVAKWCKRDSS